jgi:nucleoside-diphosphate-sugar epimerase
MNIILTGATGLIGWHLVHALCKNKHQVTCLVRPNSKAERISSLPTTAQIAIVEENQNHLYAIIKKAQPTLLIHLSSLFLHQHQSEDIPRLIQSNLQFPCQLLEACAKLGVKKIINTGTAWQHQYEESYKPANLYAATKQAFEALLTYYENAHNMRIITLKLYDTYGPRDHRPKLLNALRKAVQEGTTLKMSPGNQLIDLVFIEDIVDGFLIAINLLSESNPVPLEKSYFLGSGQPITLRNLVKQYTNVTQKTIHAEWGSIPYRPGEVMNPIPAIPTLPGWQTKINLEKGIAITEADFFSSTNHKPA